MNTVINSQLSKSVGPEEQGGALGLSAALESFSRVVAPTLGGFLIGALGTWAPGVVGSIVTGMLTIFVWLRLGAGVEAELPEPDAWPARPP